MKRVLVEGERVGHRREAEGGRSCRFGGRRCLSLKDGMITNSSLIHYSDYSHSDRTENKDFLISSVISGKFCDSNRVFAPPASMVCGSGIARAVCNGFLAAWLADLVRLR